MLRDRADFIQRRQPIKPESMLLSYRRLLEFFNGIVDDRKDDIFLFGHV